MKGAIYRELIAHSRKDIRRGCGRPERYGDLQHSGGEALTGFLKGVGLDLKDNTPFGGVAGSKGVVVSKKKKAPSNVVAVHSHAMDDYWSAEDRKKRVKGSGGGMAEAVVVEKSAMDDYWSAEDRKKRVKGSGGGMAEAVVVEKSAMGDYWPAEDRKKRVKGSGGGMATAVVVDTRTMGEYWSDEDKKPREMAPCVYDGMSEWVKAEEDAKKAAVVDTRTMHEYWSDEDRKQREKVSCGDGDMGEFVKEEGGSKKKAVVETHEYLSDEGVTRGGKRTFYEYWASEERKKRDEGKAPVFATRRVRVPLPPNKDWLQAQAAVDDLVDGGCGV